MQTNIVWSGREYDSHENCLITLGDEGAHIHSTIIGTDEGKTYEVTYTIKTNANWDTVYAEIYFRHTNQEQHIELQGDSKGNWLLNGKQAHEFNGCIDIDLPLTPFTNTLPIKRLRLNKQDEQCIQVIYIDLLEKQIRRVTQKYKRISNTHIHYENVPNDFEADIEVDADGFVIDYPQLFVRTDKLKSCIVIKNKKNF